MAPQYSPIVFLVLVVFVCVNCSVYGHEQPVGPGIHPAGAGNIPQPHPNPIPTTIPNPTIQANTGAGDIVSGLIQTVCSKHKNPIFCADLLRGKEGGTLTCLARQAIEKGRECAVNTKNNLNSMVATTSEIRLKQHYYSCVEHYDVVIESLDSALKKLDAKDYFGMSIAVSAALTDVDDCATSEAPGYDPSVALKQNNNHLEDIISVILIVANLIGAAAFGAARHVVH